MHHQRRDDRTRAYSSSSVSSELEENGDSSTDTEGRSEPHAVEESQEVILEVADEDQVDE